MIYRFIAKYSAYFWMKAERCYDGFMVGNSSFLRILCFFWVIVDKLIKSVHFMPIKTTYFIDMYAKLYVDEII